MFNWKYIFEWWIFHCHVSFRVGKSFINTGLYIWFLHHQNAISQEKVCLVNHGIPLDCSQDSVFFGVTLPKTNIAPENRPSQEEISIPTLLLSEDILPSSSSSLYIWNRGSS